MHRARRAFAFTAGARVVSIAVTAISVPLALTYLGREDYGLWLTVSGAAALLGAADLGVGNGLLVTVAAAEARSDSETSRRYISSAVLVTLTITAAFAIIVAVVDSRVNWGSALGSSAPSARIALLVAVGCALTMLPLRLAENVRSSLQDGAANGLWQAVGQGISLGLIVVAVWLRLPVAALIGLSAAGPIAGTAMNAAALARRRPDLLPRRAAVTAPATRFVLRVGSLFFMLQASTVVAYSIDNVVISRLEGSGEVPGYAVPFRLFAIASSFLGLALAPLWPAYTDALARGESGWILSTLRRSLLATAAFMTAVAVALTTCGGPIVRLWTGNRISPSTSLLIPMACWLVLGGLGTCYAVLLNASQSLAIQVVSGPIMAAANLVLSVFLGARMGVAGVMWGTVVAYLIFAVVPYALYWPSLRRKIANAGVVLA